MGVAAFIRGLPVGVVQAIKGAFDWQNSVGLTAAGTTQATALLLPRDFNVFTTVAAGSGCILPYGEDQTVSSQSVAPAGTTVASVGTLEVGDTITVVNRGANALLVYPQGTGTIQGGSAGAGFSIAVNKLADIRYVGSGNFVANLSA
jgi:hypothetical protein